jgi:hypothetical protein
MITDTAANAGRTVTEFADRRAAADQTLDADRMGILGETHEDLSFDVDFGGTVVTFPEPDREFFDWAE